MALGLSGPPPQNTSPQSNREKNIRQTQIEGHATKRLAGVLLKTVKTRND